MKKDKIAIIGTAGIPSKYGGFETLVEYLTKNLGIRIEIVVYCSSKSYTEKKVMHNHAKLNYVPLHANGIQSIFYDIVSLIRAAGKHNQILILGVSGCIFLPFFRLFYPKKKLIINIDGLEHQREKWKKSIQKFLKYSEKLAVNYGDIIITDNKAIQNYVVQEYKKNSVFIAYGGDHAQRRNLPKEVQDKYYLPAEYAFTVCRIEPENNIRMILEAFKDSPLPIVITGNWNKSKYGRYLKKKYSKNLATILIDPIYELEILDQIRSNCTAYIHGHSAGGTNPSLVEAMSLGLPVFAYDVIYNRETTFNRAKYFKTADDLINLISYNNEKEWKLLGIEMKKIADSEYTWEKIAFQYYKLFE